MRNKLKTKFGSDVLWNAGSFAVAGVIGIVINTILLQIYDASVVGVFQQVYAIYILLSQLAVAGIHLSVQRYIPKFARIKRHADVILTASLTLSLLFAAFIVGLAYLFRELPGKILQSKDVSEAFQYAVWGLLFFSMNKVLMAYHNGYRRMKAFAVFQLLRFLGMLIFLALIMAYSRNTNLIPAILALAEMLLFLVLIAFSLRYFSFSFGKRCAKWIGIHLKFGLKALTGNLLLDVNTRVDVFMLGIFVNDSLVGIYAFASTIAEGIMQIPVIFRNNINPILTKAHETGDTAETLNRLLKRNLWAFYKYISPFAAVTILLFPFGLLLLGIHESNTEIWIVYSILVGSVTVCGGYLPFQMLFNQIGMPSLQSFYIFLIFLTNVAGNYIFIRYYGIYGAAIGTGISIIGQVVFLKILLRRHSQFRI